MDVLDDLILHQILVPGYVVGINEAEAAAIRGDQAAILARPQITKVLDIPDTRGAPADGDVLVWEASNNVWRAKAAAGKIDGVYTRAGSGYEQVSTDTEGLYFGSGLVARQGTGGPHVAVIEAQYGGPGEANSVSRSDHWHEQRIDLALPIEASGTLSSGTRSLTSGTLSGLDSGRRYIVGATLIQDYRGYGPGAGRCRSSVTVHGNRKDRHPIRTVGGVDREATLLHEGTPVSGVTSVTVTATLSQVDGDPVIVGDGKLTVWVRPFS